MSSPRSCSHNRPTNPRSKPQTIAKRKRDLRSKGLSNSAQHQADRPQAPGEPFAWPRRTVRGAAADRPKITLEPPYRTLNSGPSAMARGPSAPPRTVRQDRSRTSCNKNTPTKWIERKIHKNSRRTLGLSGSSRTVRHACADCPPGENL
jgi:hypothetical protein